MTMLAMETSKPRVVRARRLTRFAYGWYVVGRFANLPYRDGLRGSLAGDLFALCAGPHYERGVRLLPHPNLKPDAYKTGKNLSSS
jgi:hypothetical protein